jgi:hypothetical protein
MLKSSDIEKLRKMIIEEAVEYTSLSREEATVVLIQYNWNIEKLRYLWYENLEENKIKCGIELTNKARIESETIKKKRNKLVNNLCRICEVSQLDNYSYSL